ncbi:DNA polymerase IV [Nakamurella sp.]|uniref:DNA polymerase IV n=1 Tax=Nakamurella sp. TaxID=1869182 RepID=UPI0037844520
MFVRIGGSRTDASILHADLDAFFASVEQRDNPRLQGRPVIVGGGVVLAASYEAKAMGVKTAMGGRQARALCPDAEVVEPRFSAYTRASKDVFEVFRDTTPLVEGLSIDEAFLDVGGLRRVAGSPAEVAARLRARVLDQVGLKITVGVARTKFLAKVASGVAKPDGLLVVEPDREFDFLHPLPVQRLWGVGPKTTAKLHALGITTVGQVAALDEATLLTALGGASGRQLNALAHNRDPRIVQVGKRRGSIGSQHAMGRGRHTMAEIDATVISLVERVTGRMRKAGREGRTVVLRLRFDDFTRASRSRTLARATSRTPIVLEAVRDLVAVAMPLIRDRGGLTLLGIAVGNLDDDSGQLELPFTDAASPTRAAALDRAMDGVREKFGSASLTRGVLLGRDPGVSMPGLPD